MSSERTEEARQKAVEVHEKQIRDLEAAKENYLAHVKKQYEDRLARVERKRAEVAAMLEDKKAEAARERDMELQRASRFDQGIQSHRDTVEKIKANARRS